jgi:hypothetical protein
MGGKSGNSNYGPGKGTGNNYHLTNGRKLSYKHNGSSKQGYCYPGKDHNHWSSSYWDKRYGCELFYDPCCSCYCYYCQPDDCWYPCDYCPYDCYCWGTAYRDKFGCRMSYRCDNVVKQIYYYPGSDHCQWSCECRDERYGCVLYYDNGCSCYYYYCQPDDCYYPVDYCPYDTYCWDDAPDQPQACNCGNNGGCCKGCGCGCQAPQPAEDQ